MNLFCQKNKPNDWGSRNLCLPNVRKDNTENGSESRPVKLPPDDAIGANVAGRLISSGVYFGIFGRINVMPLKAN